MQRVQSSLSTRSAPEVIAAVNSCARAAGLAFDVFQFFRQTVSSVVTQNPEVLGGEPVFGGTRVPARSLFDHLEAGDSIEQFLEGFPSVKREQVIALLEDSKAHVLAAR